MLVMASTSKLTNAKRPETPPSRRLFSEHIAKKSDLPVSVDIVTTMPSSRGSHMYE